MMELTIDKRINFGQIRKLNSAWKMGLHPQEIDSYTHKSLNCIHGHRTQKTPHPVRSAQITWVSPS
jgi:hypothetical protein